MWYNIKKRIKEIGVDVMNWMKLRIEIIGEP